MDGIVLLEIPRMISINVKSPVALLGSLGFFDDSDFNHQWRLITPSNDIFVAELEWVVGTFQRIVSAVWTKFGGIALASLGGSVVIACDGNVEGPEHSKESFLATRMISCSVIDFRTCKQAMMLVSTNQSARIVDVCVYDPMWMTMESHLHEIANTIGNWLRLILGDGWGLRLEVSCEKSLPIELAEDPNLKRLWLSLMLLMKSYVPHVRMMDDQAMIRFECTLRRLKIMDLIRVIIHNAYVRNGFPWVIES
jgi:hypothetical protein